jgi:hypothetical protein
MSGSTIEMNESTIKNHPCLLLNLWKYNCKKIKNKKIEKSIEYKLIQKEIFFGLGIF